MITVKWRYCDVSDGKLVIDYPSIQYIRFEIVPNYHITKVDGGILVRWYAQIIP